MLPDEFPAPPTPCSYGQPAAPQRQRTDARERESGTSKKGLVIGRVHAASVELYGWAEIAVALEIDQLSTVSHALPCTLSDEDELACNAVCHRGWDTLRNRPSGALLSEHVTTPISDTHIHT